jgi:hypothetical protein
LFCYQSHCVKVMWQIIKEKYLGCVMKRTVCKSLECN